MSRLMRALSIAFMTLCLSVGLAHADQKTVRMGQLNWEDTSAISGVAKLFLEKEGFKVETTNFAEWGIAFAALSKGDIDILVTFPDYVASDYWKKNSSRLEKVSAASFGLNQGIVVPKYVPIDSVEQLNSISDQVGGKIIGIEPGAGLMREVKEAITDYGLHYQVVDGSTPAMTAALQSALERKEPIVTMLWEPSWMMQKFDVKYLKDPKHVFDPPQAYYWVAKKGWATANPHAREVLASAFLPNADITAMSAQLKDGKTMDQAIDDWWKQHQSLIDRWAVLSSTGN